MNKIFFATQKNYAFSHKRKFSRIIWFIFGVLLFFLSIGSFLTWKIFSLEKEINQEINFGQEKKVAGKKNSTLLNALLSQEKKPLRGTENQRINLLLLGMGGEGHKGKYLTDTIMLVSLNPQTYQVAFLSIPRDLYIQIPGTSVHTKINAVYAYETENGRSTNQPLETLKKLIKDITGQEIHYYVALDFDGFQKIIDDMGGIEVEVTEDIFDPHYPGPNFSYETFQISKGFHHLDGKTALKYARVRHVSGGDFGRAKRQQKVLIAAKNKAFSKETFLHPSKIIALLNDLGEHLRTDITLEEIPSFWELAKNINVYQATNKVLDAWSADSLLASSHILLGGQNAYVLLPRGKSYSSIHKLAENIFDLDFLQRQKTAMAKEKATVSVLTEPQSAKRALSTLKKIGYNQVKINSQSNQREALCEEKSFLYYKKNSLSKPFSLNNLAQELAIEVAELPEDFFPEEDFLLCLNDQDAHYFSSQNQEESEEDEILKEKSILDQQGNILVNQ